MITLYHDLMSPQSRAVLILLTLLRIPHNIEYVDLAASLEFYPELLEMNPENTVPVIKDDDIVMLDSHAINAYLVDKYTKNDSLYPKDRIARARVDHMLHLDTGMLYPMYRGHVKTVFNQYMYKMLTGLGPKIVENNRKVYKILEEFLKRSKFIAGDVFTIADISVYTSLTQMSLYYPPDRDDFPLCVAYIGRCEKDIPLLKSINDIGIEAYSKYVKSLKYKKWQNAKKAKAKEAKAKAKEETKEVKEEQEDEVYIAEESVKS